MQGNPINGSPVWNHTETRPFAAWERGVHWIGDGTETPRPRDRLENTGHGQMQRYPSTSQRLLGQGDLPMQDRQCTGL